MSRGPGEETRTVTLELLRSGPRHNQLLSPLTPYIALCADHPPETVHLDCEQRTFLQWYEGLARHDGKGLAAQQACECVTRLLGQVQSLRSELARAGNHAHLRLVLTGAELALLPFELADIPLGLPGACRSMLVQSQPCVTVTRQGRRARQPSFEWPDQTRILFAYASPPGVVPVPAEQHYHVLRRALDGLIGWLPDDRSPNGPPRADLRSIRAQLQLLPYASLRSLAEACRAERYTHVHLLAHGGPLTDRPGAGGERYGLVLHGNSSTDRELVTGEQLAAALRGFDDQPPPAVVTVACCEGAQQGSVLVPGGSLVHELHESGIPFVVGSQLPLTMAGSVILVDGLYSGLLEGRDPRWVLHDVRVQLRALLPDKLDWAGVVAYESFPADFDEILQGGRARRLMTLLDRALARMAVDGRPEARQRVQQLIDALGNAAVASTERARYQASVALRLDDAWAERANQRSRDIRGPRPRRRHGSQDELPLTEMAEEDLLEFARKRFAENFERTGTPVSLVQKLVLDAALGRELPLAAWSAAWYVCREVQEEIRPSVLKQTPVHRTAYLADLVLVAAAQSESWGRFPQELETLAAGLAQQGEAWPGKLARASDELAAALGPESAVSADRHRQRAAQLLLAEHALWAILDCHGHSSFAAFRAWRQLRRYARWSRLPPVVRAIVRILLDRLERDGVPSYWGTRQESLRRGDSSPAGRS